MIHKNMSPERQAAEVRKAKKAQTGVVADPLTIGPDEPLGAAVSLMRGNGISGLPVVDAGKPVGILTNRDIRFAKELDQPVRTHMTTELITAPEKLVSPRPSCSFIAIESKNSSW